MIAFAIRPTETKVKLITNNYASLKVVGYDYSTMRKSTTTKGCLELVDYDYNAIAIAIINYNVN